LPGHPEIPVRIPIRTGENSISNWCHPPIGSPPHAAIISNRCHPPIGSPPHAAIGRLGLALQSISNWCHPLFQLVPPTDCHTDWQSVAGCYWTARASTPIGATHRSISNWCHPPIGSPWIAAIGRLGLSLQLVPPTFPIGATHFSNRCRPLFQLVIGAAHFSNWCHPPIGSPWIAAIGWLGLALQSVPPTFPIGATHRSISNWCHPPINLQLVPPTDQSPIGAIHRLVVRRLLLLDG
jgi:hypothetical protein